MSKRTRNNKAARESRQKRRFQSDTKRTTPLPPPISPSLLIAILVVRFTIQYVKSLFEKNEKHLFRKDLEKDVFVPLGDYLFCRAYRMSKESFSLLHDLLEPHLMDHFFPGGGGKRDPLTCPYLIKTETRLAIAIRYFAGGSPLDIVVTHGVSFASVFSSVWGVIDCVNKCEALRIHFPSKEEQLEISLGYRQKSGASFANVIGAIDGILIWILKPTKNECKVAGCQEASFKCSRKDKFGINMQAICDHKFRIRWFDMTWPGNSSDYMAWTTSDLFLELDKNPWDYIIRGMTLLGDSAYVISSFMSVPFKNNVTADKDAYNFYQSQLRITIEQTFGILVHRWAILRGPLSIPLIGVPPLMMTLCRLHNFCIDVKDVIDNENRDEHKTDENDEIYLQHLVTISNLTKDYDMISSDIVIVDENGPDGLLNRGHHFNDSPRNRQQTISSSCPMDNMLKSVQDQQLSRPPVCHN